MYGDTGRYQIGDIDNEQYYQLTKGLFANPIYKKVSPAAKVVYAILKDRMEVSRKNGWHDDNGDVYLIFSQEHLGEYMGVTTRSVRTYLQELKEAELIDSVRQGLGRPNKIYLLKCKKCTSRAEDIFLSDRKNPSAQIGRILPTSKTNKSKTNKSNNKKSGSPDCISVIHEVIDYLNTKLGTSYKYDADKTVRAITARVNDKATVEDFKKVIDTKVKDWLGNEKMEKYLRPETLFGSKFEGYLQEANMHKNKGNANNEPWMAGRSSTDLRGW